MMQAQNIEMTPIHRVVPVPPRKSAKSRSNGAGGQASTDAGGRGSSSSSLLALPVISGLCCLGLLLFLIAATIVLALIPLYTRNRSVTVTPQRNIVIFDVPLPPDSNVPLGPLNDAQKALLQNDLQNSLNNNTRTNGSTITVLNATAISTSGRKRQGRATVIRVAAEIVITFRISISIIVSAVVSTPISSNTASAITAAATTAATTTAATTTAATTTAATTTAATTTAATTTAATTTAATTTTTIATTTTNRTRRLVRRSMEEGGAPAGVLYIDAHEVAAVKGDVSTVSFYVDESCASSTIEFGAFELLHRDMTKNTAELRLTHRSGSLALSAVKDLKPYMSLITIRLCSGEVISDINSGGCQGNRFPVLPHQYIGVRSDSCRLGFAPVTVDPNERVTWKVADQSDPFQYHYDKLHYIPADYTVLHTVTIESDDKKKFGETSEPIKEKNQPRVLFLGSFPPRQCGLAKFLEDMTDAYPGAHSVVAVDEDNDEARKRTYSSKVTFRLNQADRNAYFHVADMVNSQAYDVLNIQHEYGLFGGAAGEYVIGMLAAVRKPVITTMHTIIPEPSTIYLSVTRALCATSTRVVVMSDLGRRILIDTYGVDETKIIVIPHGVPDVPYADSLEESKHNLDFDPTVPIIATFGLLHRNKNIEFALKALKTVVETEPNVLYLIIGQTHPGIISYEGESYRHELEANVTSLGLTRNVEFIDKFVSDDELLKYLAATDIYLTPYAREDQYVSGTLSWAVGLGKAVVSTPYLYAKELLADGRGFLVPFEDQTFLASTILKLIEDVTVRDAARRKAYKFGRHMTWPTVARRFEQLFRELLLFT